MNPGLPAPGDLEPIPGQLALPGMPSAAEPGGGAAGQPALPGLELPAPDGAGAGDDSELAAVATEPLEPGGGWLPDGSRLTWLNAPSGKKQDRLPARAAKHDVVLPAATGRKKYPRPAP